jgi:hypothetical protein
MQVDIQCACCHAKIGNRKSKKWGKVLSSETQSICPSCYKMMLPANRKEITIEQAAVTSQASLSGSSAPYSDFD